jgi:hypothetical protein
MDVLTLAQSQGDCISGQGRIGTCGPESGDVYGQVIGGKLSLKDFLFAEGFLFAVPQMDNRFR